MPSESIDNLELRRWPEIRTSLYATHIFGFIAFQLLGRMTHRNSSKWDMQNIIHPLIFLFFPLLYLCQIAVALPLVLRNLIYRDRQSLAYYFCGALGMYAKRISFLDEEDIHDDTSLRKGPALLLDIFKPRAEPAHKKQRSGFDLLVTLSSTLQATSTSVLYIRRCVRQDAVLLELDHRIGLMAIGSALASLACLLLLATGWDWRDTLCTPAVPKLKDYHHGSLYHFSGSERDLRGTPNVTNKHLFDWTFALCIHLVHLGYAGRFFPLFHRDSHSVQIGSATGIFQSIILPTLLVLPVGLQFIMQSYFFSTWLRYRVTAGWKSKLTRLLVFFAMVYVITLTIRSEKIEADQVFKAKITTPLNKNWAWKDTWADFLWPI